MRTTNIKIINSEFSSKTNWKEIYQWGRVKSKGNTEIISELIINNFKKIKWSNSGLRTNNFKIAEHEGYSKINTPISQFTEKRFCRALFNEYKCTPHPLIGKIIDYEVPLTAAKQKLLKINQGDIDLIAKKSDELLFFEVKKSKSTESLLKAILEIFVYVIRLSKYNLIEQLKNEYNFIKVTKFTPAILTFKDSTSGKQIIEIKKYPVFIKLIHRINQEFKKNNINELEFYIIEKPSEDYTNVLKTELSPKNPKQQKILLNSKILVRQLFPTYTSNNKLFKTKLNNCKNVKLIEMLFHSFIMYDRLKAINFIIKKLRDIQNTFNKNNNSYPRNGILSDDDKEKYIMFVEAYLNIAINYPFPEFLEINLFLLKHNHYRNKKLIPVISNFQKEDVLELLIKSYKNISIVSSKDYDGVSSKQKDLVEESIIISAICKFNSPKIIPLLNESLLEGAIGSVKIKVIKKLLEFISKEEILKNMPDFNEANAWMIRALTDKKKNSDWVIKYLNEL